MDAATHWDAIYALRAVDDLSWHESDPVTSRILVRRAIDAGARSLIDVGGGASVLVDHFLDAGLDRLAVLDVSGGALAATRQRLGDRADTVEWIVGDVTRIEDVGSFDVWHDRALFHFLTDRHAREHYLRLAQRTVPRGGHAIVATFAPRAPDHCSGLPVRRYDAAALTQEFGPGFVLVDSASHAHVTPRGVRQDLVYTVLLRDGSTAAVAASDRR